MYQRNEIKQKIDEAIIYAIAMELVDSIGAEEVKFCLYEKFGIEEK